MNRWNPIKFLVLLAILASSVGSAAAQSPQPGTAALPLAALVKPAGKLSFRLEALSNSAALRAAGNAQQAQALSLAAKGAGSLMRDASGRLLAEIRLSDLSDASLQALQEAGAVVVHVSSQYKVVTAYINPLHLAGVTSLPAVESIQEELAPLSSSQPSMPQANPFPRLPAFTCPNGDFVSEGDVQLHAIQARSTYTLTGSGVKVGILSDSADQDSFAPTHLAQDIASGDMPGVGNPCGHLTPLNVLVNSSDPNVTDEGRGMLQIVHDLAPGATLSFASAWNGLNQFADNIRLLRADGADIIADDIYYLKEPFFQDGPVGVAISDVVHDGALYFTAAGNDNQRVNGLDVGSYEAPAYRPTACPPISGISGTCHDFDPGPGINTREGITLTTGGELAFDFQWAEPWFGVSDDMDIYLVNASGTIVAAGFDNNISSQVPFEFLDYVNSAGPTQRFQVVINRFSGSGSPRLKYVLLTGGSHLQGVQYSTSSGGDIVGPTIFGHSANPDGFSVAAVPYNDANTPEYYTSRGPAAFYFGPVVNSNPAPPITPQTLNKPDFTATDGGCSTFFYIFQNGCYRFWGTSAAAPHAAAVAALLKQRANQLGLPLSPAVAGVVLRSTAQTVSNGNPASVGAGLVNALAASAKLPNIKWLYMPFVKH